MIALNLAKYSLQISPAIAYLKLPHIFQEMYNFVRTIDDNKFIDGIEPLPGVIETLKELKVRKDAVYKDSLVCGLVTGNVENIARKKMRATGILKTGILSACTPDQYCQMSGEEDSAFLGGFGSDHCSGSIDDLESMWKDRGQQISIATRRAKSLLTSNQKLVRVVHIGDAPNDILAAKWCVDQNLLGSDIVVGCIGVATGKFSREVLLSHAGEIKIGIWEPVVLENGLNDPSFIDSCQIKY